MRTSIKQYLTLVLLSIFTLTTFSCSKRGDNSPDPDQKQSDVYVVGYTSGKAKCWKNGEAIALPDNNIDARSIFVLGKDLYIAGTKSAGGQKNIAFYLKNGVETQLSDGTAKVVVTSLFVAGTDVYVSGFVVNMETDGLSAVYWRNNEKHVLAPSVYRTYANAVFVSDGNVYVAGFEEVESTGIGTAVYWKNGVKQMLPKDSEINHSAANGIYVKDNQIYIAGEEYRTAKLWKLNTSGTLISTKNLPQGINANAVFVSGNDVYAAGKGSDEKAHYWKNDNIQNLEGNEGSAYSIFVWNNEIHIAGIESNNSYYKPRYWNNSRNKSTLTGDDTNGEAYEVFVVDRQ